MKTGLCRSKLNMTIVDTDYDPLAAFITSYILVPENEQIMTGMNENSVAGPKRIIEYMARSVMVYPFILNVMLRNTEN